MGGRGNVKRLPVFQAKRQHARLTAWTNQINARLALDDADFCLERLFKSKVLEKGGYYNLDIRAGLDTLEQLRSNASFNEPAFLQVLVRNIATHSEVSSGGIINLLTTCNWSVDCVLAKACAGRLDTAVLSGHVPMLFRAIALHEILARPEGARVSNDRWSDTGGKGIPVSQWYFRNYRVFDFGYTPLDRKQQKSGWSTYVPGIRSHMQSIGYGDIPNPPVDVPRTRRTRNDPGPPPSKALPTPRRPFDPEKLQSRIRSGLVSGMQSGILSRTRGVQEDDDPRRRPKEDNARLAAHKQMMSYFSTLR